MKHYYDFFADLFLFKQAFGQVENTQLMQCIAQDFRDLGKSKPSNQQF